MTDQGIDVVHGIEIADVAALPLRPARSDRHHGLVVLRGLESHRGIVEEEAEEGTRGVAMVEPAYHSSVKIRSLLLEPGTANRPQAQIRDAGQGRPVQLHHQLLTGELENTRAGSRVADRSMSTAPSDVGEGIPVGRGETVEDENMPAARQLPPL